MFRVLFESMHFDKVEKNHKHYLGSWGEKLLASEHRVGVLTPLLVILLAAVGARAAAAQDGGSGNIAPGLPAEVMPEDLDTTPGLLPYTNNTPIHSATELRDLLKSVWALYAENQNDPAALERAQANYILEQILTGPLTTGPRNDLRVEKLGLGFTPAVINGFNWMDKYGAQLFTESSLRQTEDNFDVKPLIFNGNPADNFNVVSILTPEVTPDGKFAHGLQVFDSFDNVYEVTLAHALATLYQIRVGDEILWTRLTPEERLNWAIDLTNAWLNQRVNGPALWGQRTVNYWDGQKNVPLFTVMNGEGGWATCRVEAAPATSQQRVDQFLTTRGILIKDQDDDTNVETPFDKGSRNSHFAVAIALDINALNQIARETNGNLAAIRQAILKSAGAYEIIDLDTGFNGEASPENPWTRNVIPTAYEVGGLTFGEESFGEGDFTSLLRFCGPAAPAQIESTPANAAVLPATGNDSPPGEEQPPEVIPPSNPPKLDPGNTNRNGTLPDEMPDEAPEGDTDSDEANESPL